MELPSDNPLRDFINLVQGFILKNNRNEKKTCHLVKQNIDKLAQNGDFSLPNDASIWSTYCVLGRNIGIDSNDTDDNVAATPSGTPANVVLFDVSADASNDDNVKQQHQHRQPPHTPSYNSNTNEGVAGVAGECNERMNCIYNVGDMVAASKHWSLTIDRTVCSTSRCLLFINRRQTFGLIMRSILVPPMDGELKFGCFAKAPNMAIKLTTDYVDEDLNSASVTKYRLQVVRGVLINLINVSKYSLVSDSDSGTSEVMYHIHLTTKSSTAVSAGTSKIVVGNVLDPQQQHKLATTTAADYIK